ncbi:tyrosine recombinase [Caulifigura coniformis]|uniref:Tyrosine recombinase n=2 Tax=Caulifigura coniformis TaxID=2527983 RepID=A0A517SMA1_9PLAN|nr:tyrosine recombinase [Caulifigura coniformis]
MQGGRNGCAVEGRSLRGITATMGCRLATTDQGEDGAARSTKEFANLILACELMGCRASELAKLQISDIDFDAGTVRQPPGIGRVEMTYRLSGLLREAVGDRTDGAVFLSKKGNRWSRPQIGKSFREGRERAGLPDDIVV